MQNLLSELTALLSTDDRLVADGKLMKNKVVELALNLDPLLLRLLLKQPTLRRHFFVEVGQVQVFDKVKFQRFVSNKSFLPDSFTAFKNKIGLTVGDEYLTDSKEVVLAWPYKDCVLEGGQDRAEARRKEIFWNETLAPDQIDRLLAPKALVNVRRYAKTGEVPVDTFTTADNSITLTNLITELQEDFSEDKLISVNSKEESEQKQIAVNNLESNGYRAVFAVDKLNEGWDVLNLFDIVRLYDTRDSKAGKIGKTTMSEAQLIGRGARYCPFQLSPDQPLYGRKFDADLDHEVRVCEELYYHSAYNPKYIQELNTALQEIGMKAKDTREQRVRLKDDFKKTALYKGGFIFLNERVKYNREDIDGLDSSVVNQVHQVVLRTGYSKTVTVFDDAGPDRGVERTRQDYMLASFGVAVLRKAVQRIEFYEFSNLRKFLPRLDSIHEFLTSDKYLGRVKVEVSGLPNEIAKLTPDQKLDVAIQVLEVVAEFVASDKVEFKGSVQFKPAMVNAVFTDKTLNFMLDGGEDKEFGRSMLDASQTAYHLDLSTRAWFAFDDCFGTSEEKLLIQYIDKRYNDLKKVYAEAYLVRNEKHFKLFAFADGRPLEPDFVLFLVGKTKTDTMHYQVFIEPKGQHLLRADAWKEEFLACIKDQGQVEQLIENRQYVVWGLPFFNFGERMPEFEAGLNELLS